MTWYSTGPGIGVQLRGGLHDGRLILPGDHTFRDPAGTAGAGGFTWGAQVIISDDHGQSWHLGGVAQPDAVEPQVAETPGHPGRLLLNARSFAGDRHRRAQATSDDGGDTWSRPTVVDALIDPFCQGSLIRAREPGSGTSILLLANPASATRERLVVRRSQDGGRSWSQGLLVHRGPAAYSSMAQLAGGELAILFETGRREPYERIDLVRIGIDSIP
jgi:sialidase-1